jgi:hypothetical protein
MSTHKHTGLCRPSKNGQCLENGGLVVENFVKVIDETKLRIFFIEKGIY